MIVTTNDVCDFHERVIDHDSIVVRGRAVGAQQDRFTDDVARKFHRAMNNVMEPNVTFTHFQANDGRVSSIES